MGTAGPRTVAWGLALLGIAAAVELVVPLGESSQTFGYCCYFPTVFLPLVALLAR